MVDVKSMRDSLTTVLHSELDRLVNSLTDEDIADGYVVLKISLPYDNKLARLSRSDGIWKVEASDGQD